MLAVVLFGLSTTTYSVFHEALLLHLPGAWVDVDVAVVVGPWHKLDARLQAVLAHSGINNRSFFIIWDYERKKCGIGNSCNQRNFTPSSKPLS